jgi:hypothetical protein
MNNPNHETTGDSQNPPILSDSGLKGLELCLRVLGPSLLKQSILNLELPNHGISVNRAWKMLDDFTVARTKAGADCLDRETCEKVRALLRRLETLGLEYFLKTSSDLGVAGFLMLRNPDALLRACPDLDRLEPKSHVCMLIQTRLSKPTYCRGPSGEVVEWS